MANFEGAYGLIAANEGGYSNNPSDAGGETYRGIARNYHPAWPGWKIIDAYKNTFKDGIMPKGKVFSSNSALEEYVKLLYKTEFWDKMYGDQVLDQQVANLLFDTKINQSGGFNFMISNALNKSGKTYY